jgi:HK97 family phage prohead protease
MKDKDIERRYFKSAVTIEKRADGTNSNVIEGYAAVFNKYSDDLGGFKEIIEPGAFTDVLNDDCFCLFNHEEGSILGRNGVNVSLSQDNVGLKYRVELPNTTIANDVRELIASGIVTQSSFAFTTDLVEWSTASSSAELDIRRIKHASRLFDVSPVTYPAYPDATVAVRSRPVKEDNDTKQIDLAIIDHDKMKMEMDLLK